MVGKSLIVCPILTPETEAVSCVLPPGKWCRYIPYRIEKIGDTYERQSFDSKYDKTDCYDIENETKLDFDIDNTVALIREGSILPMIFPYKTDGSEIMTLEEIRKFNPYIIHAVLDSNEEANGFLFVDDGKRDLVLVVKKMFSNSSYKTK